MDSRNKEVGSWLQEPWELYTIFLHGGWSVQWPGGWTAQGPCGRLYKLKYIQGIGGLNFYVRPCFLTVTQTAGL